MNSSLHGIRGGGSSPSLRQQQIRHFLSQPSYPCVGAKSALNRERISFAEYSSLDSVSAAVDLCHLLAAYSNENPDPGSSPLSFIAIFGDQFDDDEAFENGLWRLLQRMHDHDSSRFEWDASVGSDPSQSNFSFSIGGRAYFVVGMHPRASRWSRRAPVPCLAFNFHNQFESMKATGKYQSMQATIRSREMRLQGSINPVLARFGEASEARQYAGRPVDAAWRCPFKKNTAAHG